MREKHWIKSDFLNVKGISRRSYPALEEVRRLAQESLPAAMSHSLRSTLDYVKSQSGVPHPTTQRVADWLDRLMAKQRSNEDE